MRKKLTMNKLGLAGLALLAFAIAGCENNGGGGGVPVTGVAIFFNGTLAPNEIDLWISPYGDDNAQRSALLEARVFPANAGNSSVTWSSSVIWSSNDNDVVNVNNGNVTVNDTPGLVTITATTIDGSHTSSAVIRVHGRPTESGNQSEHAGDLIILQAAAVAGGTGNNAHRTFVELYNRSNAAIDMDGLSLQWTGGQGDIWNVIPLSGDLPAGHSFLVLGIVGDADARLQIPNAYADKLLPDFQLNNRAFRLALMEGTMPLTVHNPSYMGHDGTIDLRTLIPATGSSEATVGTQTAAGLIDLLGVINDRADSRDIVHGAKGAPAYRISNQTSIRRANLDAPTNNFNDFRGIDWQGRAGAVADDQIPVFRPRNLAAGVWTPEFPEPDWQPPVVDSDAPVSETIVILQANRSGNNNGGGGGFPNSLVELFNLTNAPINLSGHYLHIGSGTGTAADPATTWNYVIPLTGTIPARSSFLVVSSTDTYNLFRADLPAADQTAEFNFNTANHWTVALMTGSTPFTGNPFTDEALWPYYVDMLGAGNSAVSETTFASTSLPQGPRRGGANRTGLVDTNNNSVDFGQIDFRGQWTGTNGMPNTNLYRFWPRNATMGEWDPMTGIPAVHPTVRNPTSGVVEFPVSEAPAPSTVSITGAGVAEGKLTVVAEAAAVMLSAQFEPAGANIDGVTFAWTVTNQTPAGVLTYGAVNAATFAITGAAEGTATVTLTVSGGQITEALTSSINVTVQEPLSSDGTIAAWNYTAGNFPATPQSLLATSGSTVTGTSLEFFYADGVRATLRNGDRIINAPGVAANGWFPLPANTGVTVQNSAAWIITLNTTGYENIRFSAEQASSNAGPGEFELAWRVGTTGDWTLIPGAGVTTTDLPTGDTFFQTFDNLALPSGVGDQAVVQIRVWISSEVNRQGAALGAGSGNTSINNIVFAGTALE